MHPNEQCRLSMQGQARPDVLERRRARRAQATDVLAHRARCAELWRSDPWRRAGDTAVSTFYLMSVYRRYLMPGVQSYLNERAAARRARHSADMAESERRWKLAKALKKAQPLPLFEDTP